MKIDYACESEPSAETPFLRISGFAAETIQITSSITMSVLRLEVSAFKLPPDGDKWAYAVRDVQPALVIGRHYVTERGSAPVQYNGIV